MDGILLVDKPAGWTSFDVVAKVRSILSKSAGHKVKVGHAGTLDPFATGLLILLIGKATRQADQFLKLDKAYEATLTLGKTSTTGDPEGEITSVSDHIPTKGEIVTRLNKFIGQIDQTPPAFSAIKINGQRAYDLARKGQKVELSSRKVTIYSLELMEYEYPVLKINCRVSSGTYIRSLAADIGEDLGVGAYLTELRRTSIGGYNLGKSLRTDKLTDTNLTDNIISDIMKV